MDKTAYIERLMNEGTHYFLSRPRRFGKSLFLDTLKELFEGSEELFAGLYIHERWTWSDRHPVVRLSFGGRHFVAPGDLDANLAAQLDDIEVQAGVSPRYATAPERFGHLIRTLHRQTGQRVVVLVDEYDKPILDALENQELAGANRDFLRGLYGVIKDSDAHVRFAFLTGISKFSKVSLTDITLDLRYSSICGYTERDLDTVFGPELAGLDRDQVREWYNGYRWRGDEKVYNPYDVLLLLRRRRFRAHWFETGTPAFVEAVRAPGVNRVWTRWWHGETAVGVRRGARRHEALLFQTGYLTRGWEAGRSYPNREVRESLNKQLLHLVQDTANSMARRGGARLREAERAVPSVLREHPLPR